MGQRFGVLCYCIDHYRQEAKACCPETFGECWSSKGLWNSHWHWRGLWCSIGQTKWVFCAKEECSFWVTCISTGSKRANQRHWCACYLFTGPCDNLRVQQGWGHDAGSGHRQMCFEQSLQLTLTRNRPPTGQTSWLLEPSNLHATTIEANSEQPLQHITKLLMTRTAKKLEGKRNVLRSRRIQAARTKAQNRVSASVAVIRAIAQKILHVLQSENGVRTVESDTPRWSLQKYPKRAEKRTS